MKYFDLKKAAENLLLDLEQVYPGLVVFASKEEQTVEKLAQALALFVETDLVVQLLGDPLGRGILLGICTIKDYIVNEGGGLPELLEVDDSQVYDA